MDKEITLEVTASKRKKGAVVIISSIAVLVLAVMLLRGYIKSTITRSEITTAKVEIANIENTINATGEVLPEFEEIITSPINASIKSALMDAGNKIKAGQSILTLDKSATQTDFEKQKFQLETKRTEISKLKLDLNKSFYDI
ncbi:MAG TPA: efflux transporter periplasmic adaptor subunit, partial [Mucilaginibacter sp.]